MKGKRISSVLIPVVALSMLGICSSSAFGATTGSLLFPKDSYTTGTKTVTTSSGSKKVTYHLYQHLTYVANPVDANYESLNVTVPISIDGVDVNTANAPILFNINVAGYTSSKNTASSTSGVSALASSVPSAPGGGGTSTSTSGNSDLALAAGFVVVSPGCRGRDNVTSTGIYYGKAPAAIVDLKAAVRYVRHNAGIMPGSVDWIVSAGGSAGGALSALLGASGNSELYEPYLEAIGAADVNDNIFAVGAWSPITNLDHADMAYEWEYGALKCGTSTVNATISGELKALFEDYQDGLGLIGRDGSPLTPSNINDYILTEYIEPSAAKYLAALSSSSLSSYLTKNSWITWDSSTSTATFTFSDYVSHIGSRGKSVPAFDAFFDSSAYTNVNTSSPAEVILFGDATTNARHLTNYSLQKTTGDPNATISGELQTIVDMMNPMYFIAQKNSGSAKYWYIRDGSVATDTSAMIIVDLATRAENSFGTDHVNAWEDWDQGHNVNTDPNGFIAWIDDITGFGKQTPRSSDRIADE